MEVANASMYDGSTGTGRGGADGAALTRRTASVLSGGLHPHYRDVVRTYLDNSADLVCLPASPEGQGDILDRIDDDTAASSCRRRISSAPARSVSASPKRARARARC
jgi:glycine dehydrogenase subunit 1